MALPADLAPLCDRCLGRRLVGAAGQAPQCEAGAAARVEEGWAAVESASCPVCEGAFEDFDTWVDLALKAAAAYEFSTFQVGTVFPTVCEKLEKSLSATMGQESVGESIRTEANRALTAAIAEKTGTGTAAEGERPDLVLQVDTRFWTCEARANSLFILGRYTKHRRDLPQTHWPCKRCQGGGCWQCDDVGVMYASSVEDVVAEPALPLFGASSASFHGAGREDIDALMLGEGRPFVLELMDPKRRTGDLAAWEAAVNAKTDATGVGLIEAVPASKEDVVRIKAAEYDKAYVAHCESEEAVTRDQVEAACASLVGVVLEQRTPERVSHRRADLVRKRTVHEIEVVRWDDERHFSVRVLAESGTYIKEMVSSDEGRTTPSLAAALGVPTRVALLDVMGIHDGDPEDADPSD